MRRAADWVLEVAGFLLLPERRVGRWCYNRAMQTHVYVPEGHLIYNGALMTPAEAGKYLGPGRYPVRGRLGGGPVTGLLLVVGTGQSELVRP